MTVKNALLAILAVAMLAATGSYGASIAALLAVAFELWISGIYPLVRFGRSDGKQPLGAVILGIPAAAIAAAVLLIGWLTVSMGWLIGWQPTLAIASVIWVIAQIALWVSINWRPRYRLEPTVFEAGLGALLETMATVLMLVLALGLMSLSSIFSRGKVQS